MPLQFFMGNCVYVCVVLSPFVSLFPSFVFVKKWELRAAKQLASICMQPFILSSECFYSLSLSISLIYETLIASKNNFSGQFQIIYIYKFIGQWYIVDSE